MLGLISAYVPGTGQKTLDVRARGYHFLWYLIFTLFLLYCTSLSMSIEYVYIAMYRKGLLPNMITTVELSQDILDSARLTVAELKIELALHLYEQNRLSVGKARELAELTLWEFRQLLASRQISPHYGEKELDDDLATLRELGQR